MLFRSSIDSNDLQQTPTTVITNPGNGTGFGSSIFVQGSSLSKSVFVGAPENTGTVYAFGILADFRTKLFPGSARLVELADRVQTLQVEALCWCGERATHNARLIDGQMVTEGEQVVVGDVSKDAQVSYEVLCRRHHMRKVTSRVSRPAKEESLPFNS